MKHRRVSISDEVCTMSKSTTINRRIVLKSRPVGSPILEIFRLEENAAPAAVGEEMVDDGLQITPQSFISLLEGKDYG